MDIRRKKKGNEKRVKGRMEDVTHLMEGQTHTDIEGERGREGREEGGGENCDSTSISDMKTTVIHAFTQGLGTSRTKQEDQRRGRGGGQQSESGTKKDKNKGNS